MGTLLAVVLLGLVFEFSLLLFPSAYKAALAFSALAFVLLLRPQGLLRGEG